MTLLTTLISYEIKIICSVIATILSIISFVPYILAILKEEIKPHFFSWIIWAITTSIVCLAQIVSGAGIGAWPMAISSLATIIIAIMCYIKRTGIILTSSDKFFFTTALSAIPFWYFTDDPLTAVVILTFVDLAGFIPSFRKAHKKPHEEQLFIYIAMSVSNCLTILALEKYSLTTLFFPASLSITSLAFIIFVWKSRSHLTSRSI